MGWRDRGEALKGEICKILNRTGAIKFGVFPLPRDRWSSYYIDLRVIPSFPGAFRRIGEIYLEMAQDILNRTSFHRVAGVPTAGIPFSSLLSFFLSKPFLYVRMGGELRGRERRVEGILYPGDSVLLVDDLVSSGNTLLTAANSIVSEGGVVNDAMVIIDRQEGGEKALREAEIRLHSLVKISEVAQVLYDLEVIDREQLSDILSQIV